MLVQLLLHFFCFDLLSGASWHLLSCLTAHTSGFPGIHVKNKVQLIPMESDQSHYEPSPNPVSFIRLRQEAVRRSVDDW